MVGAVKPSDKACSARADRSDTFMLCGVQTMAADGLVTIKSGFGPEQSMKRLEAEVKAKRLMVFSHLDHAAAAAAVDLRVQPTDLLIFGNAKGGTPLMQQAQTIGIDLPLKALVWQDDSGTPGCPTTIQPISPDVTALASRPRPPSPP